MSEIKPTELLKIPVVHTVALTLFLTTLFYPFMLLFVFDNKDFSSVETFKLILLVAGTLSVSYPLSIISGFSVVLFRVGMSEIVSDKGYLLFGICISILNQCMVNLVLFGFLGSYKIHVFTFNEIIRDNYYFSAGVNLFLCILFSNKFPSFKRNRSNL
jgi:hypothetical protein